MVLTTPFILTILTLTIISLLSPSSPSSSPSYPLSNPNFLVLNTTALKNEYKKTGGSGGLPIRDFYEVFLGGGCAGYWIGNEGGGGDTVCWGGVGNFKPLDLIQSDLSLHGSTENISSQGLPQEIQTIFEDSVNPKLKTVYSLTVITWVFCILELFLGGLVWSLISTILLLTTSLLLYTTQSSALKSLTSLSPQSKIQLLRNPKLTTIFLGAFATSLISTIIWILLIKFISTSSSFPSVSKLEMSWKFNPIAYKWLKGRGWALEETQTRSQVPLRNQNQDCELGNGGLENKVNRVGKGRWGKAFGEWLKFGEGRKKYSSSLVVHTGAGAGVQDGNNGGGVKIEPEPEVGDGDGEEGKPWWKKTIRGEGRVVKKRNSWWAPGWDVERLGFDSSVGQGGGITVGGSGVREGNGDGAEVVHSERWYID